MLKKGHKEAFKSYHKYWHGTRACKAHPTITSWEGARKNDLLAGNATRKGERRRAKASIGKSR